MMLVMLNRNDYWQCAYVIPKGSIEEVYRRGLEVFRADIAKAVPDFGDRVGEIADWDQVKLLTVAVDRLNRWHKPGLLCIGDAAHAMSPIGGVGINLAIQDAVAAANILTRPLLNGACGIEELRQVQRRREWPTKVIQGMQVLVQKRIIFPTLGRAAPLTVPWLVTLLDHSSWLRGIPARIVGVGVRPEHVEDRRGGG